MRASQGANDRGRDSISIPTANWLNPTTIEMTATITVDISSGTDDLLCKKGVLAVRIMWITKTWDTVPNTNHPL